MRKMCVGLLVTALVLATRVSSAATIQELLERIERLEARVMTLEDQLRKKTEELNDMRRGQRTPPPNLGGNAIKDNLDQMDELVDRMRDLFGRQGQSRRQWGQQILPPELRNWNRARGGHLGVQIEDVHNGVAIQSVLPDSPAQKAGLVAGDVIVKIDGKIMTSSTEVVEAVSSHRPGKAVDVTVLRDGAEVTIPVVLGKRNAQQFFNFDFRNPGRFPDTLQRWHRGRIGRPGDASDSVEVEVETRSGVVTVKMSTPQLQLSEQMVTAAGLTDVERSQVERELGAARDKFIERLTAAVTEADGTIATGTINELLSRAVSKSLEKLSALLPADKSATLRRLLEDAGRNSNVSASIKKGAPKKRVETPVMPELRHNAEVEGEEF